MRHERLEADLLAPRRPARSLALAAEQVPYETRFAQVLSHAEIVARFSRALHATLAPGTTVARCSDPPPPLTLETVRLVGKRLEVSNALAKHELGYSPGVSREVGVVRLRAAQIHPNRAESRLGSALP